MESCTAQSNPNIAIIKYWGKSNIDQNNPTNKSISLTLTKLITTTKISLHNKLTFIFNKKPCEVPQGINKILNYLKITFKIFLNIKIESENNFYDSCGLASSASGYSAFVKALNNFFNLNLTNEEISSIARYGSGSACRSIYNGFVIFDFDISKFKDEVINGWYAKKIGDWPELKVFFLVLNSEKKKVSSTIGMLQTQNTSPFFNFRLKNLETKISKLLKAIDEKNFQTFCEIAIKESNEIHSLCLNSYPPIFYLNDESFKVMDLVFKINSEEIKVAYTFDAGANPFIITKEEYYDEVKGVFKKLFTCEIVDAL